jgi:hypothetical protein
MCLALGNIIDCGENWKQGMEWEGGAKHIKPLMLCAYIYHIQT